jgi:type IV pilus assembly protein PilC
VQLATLSEAGIPVVKALTILEGQTRPGPFKDVLAELVEDVSSGAPLSDALAKHERAFDTLYSSMVRAGEAGGVLDRVLQRLAVFRVGVTLPGVTQLLLDISEFVVGYWYIVFGAPIVFAIVHGILMRRSRAYRKRVHGLLLRLPVLGGVYSRSQCRTSTPSPSCARRRRTKC